MAGNFDPKAVEKATKHAAELLTRLQAVVDPLLQAARKGRYTASEMAAHTLRMRTLREEFQAVQSYLTESYGTLCHELTPAAFEREEAKSLNLNIGYRVTITQNYYASIIPESRTLAFKWLRDHKMKDLIQETVNAKTLSAVGKKMLEEENTELPSKFFKCHLEPNTSITKID